MSRNRIIAGVAAVCFITGVAGQRSRWDEDCGSLRIYDNRVDEKGLFASDEWKFYAGVLLPDVPSEGMGRRYRCWSLGFGSAAAFGCRKAGCQR